MERVCGYCLAAGVRGHVTFMPKANGEESAHCRVHGELYTGADAAVWLIVDKAGRVVGASNTDGGDLMKTHKAIRLPMRAGVDTEARKRIDGAREELEMLNRSIVEATRQFKALGKALSRMNVAVAEKQAAFREAERLEMAALDRAVAVSRLAQQAEARRPLRRAR